MITSQTKKIENAPARTLVVINGSVGRTQGFAKAGRLVDFAPGELRQQLVAIPRGTDCEVLHGDKI